MAPDRGFFREGKHGREVDVAQVSVEPSREGKFRMTAVINGQAVSHEISQKQYDKFLAVDDYQRMRMVSKVFDEFDMKVRASSRMGLDEVSLGARMAVSDDMYTAHKPAYEPSVFTTTRSFSVRVSYAFPLGVITKLSSLILALMLPQVRATSLSSRSLCPASITSFLASDSV
jgi:hypothetical protein